MATTGTIGEPKTEPTPEPTPTPTPPTPEPIKPSAQDAARQAKAGVAVGSRKEDASTVTPAAVLEKVDQTVGGRYEKATAERIARRDAGLRFNVAVCPTCGHEETLKPGGPPRTSYMACPECGDTLRFTGVPVRMPNAEPLPSIRDDEMRAS